jgi:hypothetical protein
VSSTAGICFCFRYCVVPKYQCISLHLASRTRYYSRVALLSGLRLGFRFRYSNFFHPGVSSRRHQLPLTGFTHIHDFCLVGICFGFHLLFREFNPRDDPRHFVENREVSTTGRNRRESRLQLTTYPPTPVDFFAPFRDLTITGSPLVMSPSLNPPPQYLNSH